jgi:hypothetical protein
MLLTLFTPMRHFACQSEPTVLANPIASKEHCTNLASAEHGPPSNFRSDFCPQVSPKTSRMSSARARHTFASSEPQFRWVALRSMPMLDPQPAHPLCSHVGASSTLTATEGRPSGSGTNPPIDAPTLLLPQTTASDQRPKVGAYRSKTSRRRAGAALMKTLAMSG